MPLGPLNGDPQMRNSITVQSNAAKGALYASMVVFGGTKTPSVQLLGRDSMLPYNAGAHPWTTAEGAASTLVMFNYSSAPQTFFVAIASGGVLWQQRYQLAALETTALDIGSLIATGAKDESGLVLPAAATSGVAQWFTPNFGQGAGRLLVSQPSIGLARNFGSLNMVVLGGTSSMPNDNVTIAAGGSGQMGPYQVDLYMGQVGYCGGTYDMTTPWSTNWTSSNPSVASIPTPSGPPAATINGNTAGSAGITVAGITQEYNYQPLDLQWWCTAPPQTGTVTVQAPSSLTVVSSGVASPGCTGNHNYGIQASVTYQVMDQNNPPQPMKVAGMTPWESGTYPDGSNLPLGQLGPATDSNGQFTDSAVGACQNLPMSTSLTFTQTIQMQYNTPKPTYTVRTNNWTESDLAGIAGFGHGTVTNGNDVKVTR